MSKSMRVRYAKNDTSTVHPRHELLSASFLSNLEIGASNEHRRFNGGGEKNKQEVGYLHCLS